MGPKIFPRGIDPELLVSQVRNTMPYLFDEGRAHDPLEKFLPALFVRNFEQELKTGKALDHFEYFRLCLSSHYLTCGTPVPTDVDNQIRLKLWPQGLPLATVLPMANFVLESRGWDFTLVSSRSVRGPSGSTLENEVLSGHHGEWFTVACGAYCALGRYVEPEALAVREVLYHSIRDEVNRHSEIFGALWRAKDGLGCLKASATIAHNFGDLDRVMDMWSLDVGDPLRLQFYKLTAQPFDSESKLRHKGRLWVAGELYKSKIDGSSMAIENHRHFGLRKPRRLRERPEFVVPIAPFFDSWGESIGLFETESEPSEIFTSLLESWNRQVGSFAYGRAIRAILLRRPEFRKNPATEALFKDHSTRSVLETACDVFESRWAAEALRWMDEIPGRADSVSRR